MEYTNSRLPKHPWDRPPEGTYIQNTRSNSRLSAPPFFKAMCVSWCFHMFLSIASCISKSWYVSQILGCVKDKHGEHGGIQTLQLSMTQSLWHLKAMPKTCAMPATRSKLKLNCHLNPIPWQYMNLLANWCQPSPPVSWRPSKTQLQHGTGGWPQTVRPICVPNWRFGGWVKAARLRPTPQMWRRWGPSNDWTFTKKNPTLH